jgi:hypothetical protein
MSFLLIPRLKVNEDFSEGAAPAEDVAPFEFETDAADEVDAVDAGLGDAGVLGFETLPAPLAGERLEGNNPCASKAPKAPFRFGASMRPDTLDPFPETAV